MPAFKISSGSFLDAPCHLAAQELVQHYEKDVASARDKAPEVRWELADWVHNSSFPILPNVSFCRDQNMEQLY